MDSALLLVIQLDLNVVMDLLQDRNKLEAVGAVKLKGLL